MNVYDSSKFWLPKLELSPSLWLRDWIPQTASIDYNEDLLAPALIGQDCEEYTRLYYAVQNVLEMAFTGPVFVRTDITSAKHAGKHAYKIENYNDINDALLITLSHAQLKSYHSKVKSSAILLRKWIQAPASRTAFGGLAIGNEWRVFADQRGVQCAHRYWPKEALFGKMDDRMEPDDNWFQFWIQRDILVAAKNAAKSMGQLKWSIDFMEDQNGKMWLTDMATAMNSYHEPSCEFSQLDNFERI